MAPAQRCAPPDAAVVEAASLPEGGIRVRWDGEDDVSGIASFDVQVRRLPDGDWIDWLTQTTEHEAVFVAPDDLHYRLQQTHRRRAPPG